MILQYQQIDKEQIASLHFPATEVLKEKEEVSQRKTDLERALALGNLEHLNMKIYIDKDKI